MSGYIVWVGGVAIAEDVDYATAMVLWSEYDLKGYEDVIVEGIINDKQQ
jgi:hypothetical protein